MKRTPIKRKTPLRAKTKIRVAGHSTVAEQKQEIQSLLRHIVISRDKKCILYGERCYSSFGVEGIVWQADHLITRASSATFADSRLVVLICKSCHAWKSLGSNARKAQYDAIVRTKLPKDRVALWDKCEKDSWRPMRMSAPDWKLSIIALRQELKNV